MRLIYGYPTPPPCFLTGTFTKVLRWRWDVLQAEEASGAFIENGCWSYIFLVDSSKMIQDKFVGLALAILSTMAIGTSFVITKKGLLEASERHGFEGDGFAYLKSLTWWGGIVTMVLGEVANFAAYAFAPAILVTPLGALSVLIGAVLGSYFLKEELGSLGKLGCALCLIGSVIIVLHAPPDKEVQTVDEILHYAIEPGKR